MPSFLTHRICYMTLYCYFLNHYNFALNYYEIAFFSFSLSLQFKLQYHLPLKLTTQLGTHSHILSFCFYLDLALYCHKEHTTFKDIQLCLNCFKEKVLWLRVLLNVVQLLLCIKTITTYTLKKSTKNKPNKIKYKKTGKNSQKIEMPFGQKKK